MNKVLLIYTGGTIGMGHNPLTGLWNHLISTTWLNRCLNSARSRPKLTFTSLRHPSTRATFHLSDGPTWYASSRATTTITMVLSSCMEPTPWPTQHRPYRSCWATSPSPLSSLDRNFPSDSYAPMARRTLLPA